MNRSLGGTLVLVTALVSSGCLQQESEEFAPLDNPFEAGVGLGEFRLGESTFLDCLIAYPRAKATFAGTDDGYLLELFLPRIAMRLTFPMGRESLTTMRLENMKHLVIDAENTARANPRIGQTTLGDIWFGIPGRSEDADSGRPFGGITLDKLTHTAIQLGSTFDEVVDALGESNTPRDPTRRRYDDEEESDRPRYRSGSISMHWDGLVLGLTKPSDSDPHEQPYLTSLQVYQPLQAD